jgi:hypothetical protein
MQLAWTLVAVFVGTVFAYKRYDGYQVVRVVPQTEQHVLALPKLSGMLGFELDFWKEARRVGAYSDIMVAPHQTQALLAALKAYGFKPTITVDNVAHLIDRSMKEMQEKAARSAFAGDDPTEIQLDQYHTFADMMTYLRAVADKYSSFVTLGSLGNSLQNRDMLYIKIGTPPQAGQTKNALFIDAGIHAREWIAPATAIWTIYELVSNYTTTYKSLLDAIDIYVAPSINPDGYEYSRTNDRNWRKNRSGPRQGCYGVDLNRNYPFHFGEAGTSTSPCSDIYRGPSAVSEIETSRLKTFLDANASTIKAYLTLHSYGQDWIYPWGYAVHTYPPDVADLRALGLQAAAAIRAVHGTQYVVDNSADSLYPAAGASDDYSKSVGIKFVYTVELRPGENDASGFNLPARLIIPTAEEAFAGFKVVAQRVKDGPF